MYRRFLVATLLWFCAATHAAPPMAWVNDLGSHDAETRETAFSTADAYGPEAIVPAAALLDHGDPGIVRAAHIALEAVVGAHLEPEERRIETATALCRAVLAVQHKDWLLWLLSYAGGEESIAPLLVLLKQDEPVAERVRQTLESIVRHRVVSEEKRRALLQGITERLPEASPTLAAGLLYTAGMLGTAEAVDLLAAQLSDDELRPAALAGLVLCLDSGRARDVRVSKPTLDFALARAASLAGDDARNAYEDLLDDARDPAARTAAIVGFGQHVAGTRDLKALVEELGHVRADVAGAARDALVAYEHPEAFEDLAKLADRARGLERVGLLEVLQRRDPEAARPHLEKVARGRDAVARVAALTLLNEPPDEDAAEAFLEIATSGEQVVRLAGQQGYIGLAERVLNNGEIGRARDMLHTALGFADRPAEQVRILDALAAIADLASLTVLEEAMTRGVDAGAIARCRLAIAGNADEETAVALYRQVLKGANDRGAMNAAVAGLQALGVREDFARNAGFVTAWRLAGPFAAGGIGDVLPPESDTSPDAAFTGLDGAAVSWTAFTTPDVLGLVDLTTPFGPQEKVVAYGVATVTVPEEEDILLKMGSDDGIVVWVNGKKAHVNDASRPVRPDEDTKPATLVAGDNEILVKVLQGTGGWGFCLRLTDTKGHPLPFTQP